jgi:hypothetical protein
MITYAGSAHAGEMFANVSLDAGSNGFNSFGEYAYTYSIWEDFLGVPARDSFGITHVITNTETYWSGETGSGTWNRNLPSYTVPTPPKCYKAMLAVPAVCRDEYRRVEQRK